MEILLAAMSAVVYGTADFLGGVASKRAASAAVAWLSQIVGLAMLAVAAPLWPHPELTAADWWWGAAGGFFGGVGLTIFYAALARGPMTVVAPLAAVISAILPLVVGLVGGDRPGTVAWIGLGLAFPAIVLVARGSAVEEARVAPATLAMSVVSGAMFGSFFVALAQTHSRSGMVPLLSARFASVGLLAIVVLVGRVRLAVPRGDRGAVVASGALDVSANGMFLVAVSTGLLSTVAVISAMYPASTVVLARVVLGERLSRWQLIGLVLAAAAVALVAAGR